jgi:hypothetical protein
MAHYAFLDENNVVFQVITGVDETVTQTDTDGTQVGGSTEAWETFYTNVVNQEGVTVKRTSYNGNFRGLYAGLGYSYNEEEDIFIAPQPYPSWTRNGSLWEAPNPMPTDGKLYTWNEDSISWDEVN